MKKCLTVCQGVAMELLRLCRMVAKVLLVVARVLLCVY